MLLDVGNFHTNKQDRKSPKDLHRQARCTSSMRTSTSPDWCFVRSCLLLLASSRSLSRLGKLANLGSANSEHNPLPSCTSHPTNNVASRKLFQTPSLGSMLACRGIVVRAHQTRSFNDRLARFLEWDARVEQAL